MPEGTAHRILIVATEEVVGSGVHEELAQHLRDGHNEAFLIAPAITGSAFKHAMGDVDEGWADARQRLEQSLETLSHERLEMKGANVGDADPILAIEDALAQFPADEILIFTRPEDESRWLESDVFERAKVQFEPEIVHVSLGHSDHHVEDVESAAAGVEPPSDKEWDPESQNLPPFSVRDLAGIAVAIIGSVVLVALAGTCEGDAVQREGGVTGEGTEGNCVAVYIIAGLTVLINLAHVVGLVLFQSVRYRGGVERFFSRMSLVGTPAAIVAALLLH